MFPRNLTLFRLPAGYQWGEPQHHDELESDLRDYALRPVGALQVETRGFVPPLGEGSLELAPRIGNAIWLTVGIQTKLLPTSVIDAEVRKRLAEIEGREGRKLGAHIRRQIRADVVAELLPRAFVRHRRMNAFVFADLNLLAVDTSSRKAAESVVSEIRHARGTFPALPLNAEVAPRSVLTGWLAGESMPAGCALGDEAVLADPVADGATVTCRGQELQSDEIAQHLAAGKQATRVGVYHDDRLSFTIGEDLVIRKLKFLDGALEALEGRESEDIRDELLARFTLATGEIRQLFGVLEQTFRITRPD